MAREARWTARADLVGVDLSHFISDIEVVHTDHEREAGVRGRVVGGVFWAQGNLEIYGNAVLNDQGHVVIERLYVQAQPNDHLGAGVTAQGLRGISVAKALDEVRQRAEHQLLVAAENFKPWTSDEFAALMADTAVGKTATRKGRPPIPDEDLRRTAELYLQEAAAGRGVRRRVAEQLGRPESTVRDWVRAARSAGWLASGRHGARDVQPGWRLVRERLERNARELGERHQGPFPSDEAES